MAEYIKYSLYSKSKTVNTPYGGTLYQSLYIDVSAGYDADTIASEFTFTTDADWIDLTPNGNHPYLEVVKDTSGNDCPQVICLWSVSTNNTGVERTGVINIEHIGGWTATYTITQIGGIISIDDIPEDAYKVIVPGTTPWVTTRNQENFPDYNWDRAEKVLYMTGDCLRKPSASLYVPESWITEDTIVNYCIEADKNCSSNINDWLYDFGKDNGWWISNDYPSFKHWGFDVGSRYTFEQTNVTHRTVKLTIVLRNYDEEIGNYFAIPFRIVQCKKGITKAEFDELVKLYGPSNYDGTMNNLDRFGFEEVDTSNPSTPETPEQLVVPEGKFTSDDLTISADGGTFWTRFDITNMTYEYYNNLVSPRGKAHSAEVTWQNEKFFSDENEWVYGNLGAVNAHLKKDRTTGKPYLYVKYSVNPNTTNYKLTSYMMYRYWGTIKGAAQINADPLFECKIPVYQLPASDTITKTESLPDKPIGIAGETAVGAVECGYTNTLDVFAIAEEDIKTKLNVYSTAEWLKIKDITYNKN